jgi:hypothetical protein
MKLERGINLGGYLSQCVHSTEHYDAFIQEEDIRKIASMGFDHVRLAIDYEVLEDEYGRTREEGFAYVTRVVKWCKRQGLNIVLDLHKAYGYDFNNAGDKKKKFPPCTRRCVWITLLAWKNCIEIMPAPVRLPSVWNISMIIYIIVSLSRHSPLMPAYLPVI